MEHTIETLRWDSDDCYRFGIDESEIGNLLFTDETQPMRLWDAAHENKNLPRKVHDVSKCYYIHIKNIFYSHDLVKDAKCNGNVRGLGNSNRLSLTLFIQQSILAFYKRPETKQSKRPLDWIEVVDAMLLHFVGDHSSCECLER